MTSARERLRDVLADHKLELQHPPAVMDEVHAWMREPGIDDPTLTDLRHLAFVTVDGAGTRDLDQALHISRHDGGFVVRYALADAAHFVRPGSALFAEALRRGASYYLPGLCVPMLPRALSEGLVSLNPTVDRRAMVFETTLDAHGQRLNSRVLRARIHSRHQLHFAGVLTFLEGRPGHGIEDPDVAQSLRAMEALGELMLASAQERNAVPHRAAETRVKVGDDPAMGFIAIERMRNRVERYNEQLSLLCNTEGASLLQAATAAAQPIYRTHAPPDEERLDELAARIAAIVADRQLAPGFAWDRSRRRLGDYLRELPAHPDAAPLVEALHRQAIMVNVRSQFSAEPGPHFGIGADVYARFSAPMREVVGVFVHKEMWEVGGFSAPSDAAADATLQGQVIAAANRARQLQRELTHAANRLVIEQLLQPDLQRPRPERPRRLGTVMGLRKDKIYVKLDDPPVDVKVYCGKLDPPALADRVGARMVRGGAVIARLGDRVEVVVSDRDDRSGRFLLDLI